VHWTLFFLASSVVFTTVVAMSDKPAVGPDTDVEVLVEVDDEDELLLLDVEVLVLVLVLVLVELEELVVFLRP